MTTDVDQYFAEGCGRCHLGGTPDCKVHKWGEELKQLRRIVLDCGLNEEAKWGVPCYTYRGANVLIISAFVNHAALSFFKGVLLQDEHQLLEKPGENSQSARVLRFSSPQQILEVEPFIKAYIFEAVEIEKAGLKVDFKDSKNLDYPEELHQTMDEMPEFKKAFEALTPGRQRGYVLYFSAPKQSKTKYARIEKYIPQILAGRGLHDR